MLGFIQNGGDKPPGLRVPSRRKKFVWAAALVGGVALAALVTQSISTQVQLTTRSIPPGIVNTSAFHAVESTVSVPVPPMSSNGYRFSYWKLNGTRQQDAYGISVTAFSFKIFENSDAVAHYTLETADTDADGVADWYEFFNYGDLAQNPDSDTDGDGVSFRDEFVKGSQPRIQDSAADGGVLEGGISRRRAEKMAVIVGTDWNFYSETSTPPGVVSRAEYLKAGTRVTTANLSGEIHGHRFAQWTVNGIRQESPVGVALSQVNLVIEADTSAVAQYVPKAQDLDADQIPDWYEFNQYGTTDIGADSDSDGDGRTFAEEYAVGTQPRIADSADDGSVLEGGISRRRGEKLALAFSEQYVRYIETSQPPGVVSRDTYFTVGTSVSTPNAPQEIYGHKFAQWTLNGVRQASPAGIAVSQVSFPISEETTAIAYYYPATQDLDADQIPDWYEYQQYGTTDFGPDSDNDEDGVNFLAEYLGGTQPRIHDSAAEGGILEGGVSRRRGEKMVVNLQFFPAERRLLVENQLEEFFGDPYNQLTGGFGIGPAGAAAPALGDLDGDGDFDMIVAGADGTLRAFENRGSPLMASFVERAVWAAGLEGLPAGPLYPSFGDWDRDGRADLAIGSNDGVIRFRKSNGFSAPPTAAGSLTAATGAAIPAFLPNSTGGVDLLALKPDGLVARYTYTGNPLAPYADPAASESILPEPIENGRALSVADANGDGLLDILASDTDGRMWLFRSVSTGGYILNSKVWGGAYAGFANDLRAVVADLNGDGGPDILGGTGDGGLLHLRNPAKKLRIDPPLKTVNAGEGIPFRSIDNDGTLRWDFARNASGGSIDPLTGNYTAGPNAGIDGIIARSSKGLTGSAWVNVLDPSENEDIGRGIIVAGRRSPNDPVWPAARSLANRAYEVFRYRGYRASDISFLGHEPKDPGVGGAPTREAIQQALANAAGAPSVVLYLVDHGRVAPGGNDGLFLLDKNEQFSGTELDGWLDTFQAANPSTDVVVILECCYAQQLAEKIGAGNPPRRAVYASSSRDQVAVMVAGGSVSYSAMLWSELSLGRTFAEAHAAALLAMQRFQTPYAWDGAGLGNRGLGLGNVSEVARPSIGAVNAPHVLNGSSVANLWASGVDGSFQIERVWAVVVPPGYTPDGDAPITDLPEIQLLWNPSNQRYEVEYGGFTEGGPDNPYTLLVYARDIWGQVSSPLVTTVTQNGCLNRAVILAHGGQKNKGGMTKVHLVADFAHETTLLRRVEPENIRYLSENASNPRRTGPASAESLRQSIVNWSLPPGKTLNALTLYLVGEADQTGILFENGDKVSHAQLAGWLDQLQNATGCIVHLIVDSDYSGRFLAACASTVHERVVIASCGPNERNPGASEWAGLSKWLWQAIAKGQDLRSGFGYASDLMSWLGEVPFMIDDDGDGIYNRAKDGFQALASFIGAAFITANDPPHIGLASPPIEAAQTEIVNFWAANIVMPDGNPPAKVWAELIDPSGALEKTIDLVWNKVYERYDGFASGFSSTGRYVALVYAGNPLDPKNVSSPAPIQIFVDVAPPSMGTEGSTSGLKLPLTGQVFDASIEAGGEPFDARLHAVPGQKITLEVFGVSPGRNVSLAILAPNGKEILRRDEWGNGFGERIWAWEPTAAGNYRVRVTTTASNGRADFSIRGFLQQETVEVGSRLNQAIIFNLAASYNALAGPLSLNATASSNLPVRFEVLSGPATLQENILNPTKQAGAVVIRALQDGNNIYAPAMHVTRVLNMEFDGQGDEDKDGLTNSQEQALETDASIADTDGDGISDMAEAEAGSDPLRAVAIAEEMISVEGGALPEGSALAGETVEGFQIGKNEVTWAEWKAVRHWAVANGYSDMANVGSGGSQAHPVRDVTWYDVVKWCNAKSEWEGLTPVYTVNGTVYRVGKFASDASNAVETSPTASGYRLPTEAQWEWAARGGLSSQNRTYSGSNIVGEVAWYFENSKDGTKQVGTKLANELGIHDMSGNVWEWCWNETEGPARQIRGGGFLSLADANRIANRDESRSPDVREGSLGFRLVAGLKASQLIQAEVSLSALSQSYDGSTRTVIVDSNPPGLQVSVTYNGSATAPANAGNYTVNATITQPGYSGSATGTLTIARKGLTITGLSGVDKFHDGTTSASVSGTSVLAGVMPGDTVVLGGVPAFAFLDSNAGAGKSITASGFAISGTSAANYILNQPSGLTATIHTAAPPTIANATISGTFGQPLSHQLSTTGNLIGFSKSGGIIPSGVSLNTSTGVLSGTPAAAGTFTANIVVSNPGGSAVGKVVFNVAKAAQSISGLSSSAQVGVAALHLPGAVATSNLPITYTSSNTSIATVSGNAIQGRMPGTVTITARQSGNSNWLAAANVTQTLQIIKGSQTINFQTLAPRIFGSAPFALNATTNRGLPVSYGSSNPSVATVSGNLVTILSAGNTTITALQAGSSLYNEATPVEQLLTISKANQTITFPAPASRPVGSGSFQLNATASSGLPVEYSSSNSSVATVSGNLVTIVGVGTTTLNATQAGNSNFQAAPVVARAFTVSPISPSVSTGGAGSMASRSATLDAQVLSTGGAPILERGFFLSTTNGFANGLGTKVSASGNFAAGSFSMNATALLPSTTYYYKAFARSSGGTAYGAQQSFATLKAAPVIASFSMAGQVGVAQTRTINATNSPDSFAVSAGSLPVGLTLNSTTGILAGTPTAAGSGNFTISATNNGGAGARLVTFVIAKGNQTISGIAGTTNRAVGTNLPAGGDTNSGLPITYTTSNAGVVSIGANGTLNTLIPGVALITATQAGNTNWNAAQAMRQVVTVGTPLAGVVFTPPSSLVYNGLAKTHAASVAGVSAWSYHYTGREGTVYYGTAAPIFAGSYTVTAVSGTGTKPGFATMNFTITPKPVTLVLSGLNKTYDGTTAASAVAMVQGLVGTDNVVAGGAPVLAFASPAAGSGKAVTVSGYVLTGTRASNYELIEPSGITANIAARALTLAANPVTKVLGESLTSVSASTAFTASGLVSGDAVSSLTMTYGAGASAESPAGLYSGQAVPSAAVFSSGSPSNYAIEYIAGDILVAPPAPEFSRPVNDGNGTVTVRWSEEAGAIGYQIQSSLNATMSGAIVGNATETEATYVLGDNTVNFFRVRSVHSGFTGPWSARQVVQLVRINPNTTHYAGLAATPENFTVDGIFGANNEAGLAAAANSTNATQIQFLTPSGALSPVIFRSSTANAWNQGTNTSAGGISIPAGTGFTLRNPSTTMKQYVVLSGPAFANTSPVSLAPNGAGKWTLFSPLRSRPSLLSDLGFNPSAAPGNFLAGSSQSASDYIIVNDGRTGSKTYWFNILENRWYSGTTPQTTTPTVPAGVGLYIWQQSASTWNLWQVPVD